MFAITGRLALIFSVLALSAFSVLSALPTPAKAQSAPRSKREVAPPGYSEAIGDAVHELELGNFAEAREQFRRAHTISPNARTLRGLGLVEFELRNYGESAELLQQSLDSDVKPLEGKLRSDAEKVLQRAKGYLGEVHVAMVPDAATVTVDGTVMEVGPSGKLVLEVGDHVFEFHAEGRLPSKQTVSVKGGETESLRVVLTPVVAATPRQPPTAESAPVQQPPNREQSLLTRQYVAIGVGAIAAGSLVTSLVFGLQAKDKRDRADCDNACPDARAKRLNDSARTAGNVSTATLVIGAAGLAGGALLFFWPRPTKQETKTGGLSARLTPALSPDFAGASLGGTW